MDKANRSKVYHKKNGVIHSEALENADSFKLSVLNSLETFNKSYEKHPTNLLAKQQKILTSSLDATYPVSFNYQTFLRKYYSALQA